MCLAIAMSCESLAKAIDVPLRGMSSHRTATRCGDELKAFGERVHDPHADLVGLGKVVSERFLPWWN